MAYTKREKQILRSIHNIEVKYSIRGNDEYNKKIWKELATNLKRKGVKSITESENKKLKKIGGMTIILYHLNRSLMGYM